MESKTKLAPTWGLGFNFYLSKMVALGVEWRMIPFSWNRAGFDTRGLDQNGAERCRVSSPTGRSTTNDSTYKFNQMISLSLGLLRSRRAEDHRLSFDESPDRDGALAAPSAV